ncbi:MAG TPA: diguanylate cyclase, partial [Acidimicrobiia bacterium]|nr:diguanylate cyclase [Acidimicrobiia bacterium]
MAAREHTRRFVTASAVVFAVGPAAMLVIPWLQRAHLIADTPVVVLLGLVAACSVCNLTVIGLESGLSPSTGLHLRTAAAAISTAWVIYAAGWGSMLTIAYAIGIADAMRVHGSRAWRPGLLWSGVAMVLGEAAIATGAAPSILPIATAHAVAGTTFVCLTLVVRTLGHSTAATERATSRIDEGRAYFRDLVQHAADVIALIGPDLRFEYVSPSIEVLVGRSPTACVGLAIADVLGAEAGADICRAYDTLAFSDFLSCEWHVTSTPGERRQVFGRLTRRSDDSLVLNLRDITEQRALEERLVHRAMVDELTGLPNRLSQIQRLASLGTLVDTTVLFIDLDGFKEVNDSLGHERGDDVLRSIAMCMSADLADGVFLGRLGGDEFLAVLSSSDVARAQALASALVRR